MQFVSSVQNRFFAKSLDCPQCKGEDWHNIEYWDDNHLKSKCFFICTKILGLSIEVLNYSVERVILKEQKLVMNF